MFLSTVYNVKEGLYDGRGSQRKQGTRGAHNKGNPDCPKALNAKVSRVSTPHKTKQAVDMKVAAKTAQ